MDLSVYLHRSGSGQHKEELLRLRMMMPDLDTIRRHGLLDHTQIAIADKMPAVTTLSPCVVFCGMPVGH